MTNIHSIVSLSSSLALGLDELTDDLDEIEELVKDYESNLEFLRAQPWNHKRVDWAEHVKQLFHENMFEVEYRMSHKAWIKLRSILSTYLERNNKRSRALDPITIEIIMGTGMRYLAGGKINDIRHIYHTSKTAAYSCVMCFIEAVNTAPGLDINLPQTASEWEDVRKGFACRSTGGLLNGCVGALDGFFQAINAPWRKIVGNVVAYYSGHYESYGLNCQAACDAKLKFLYFCVVAPGKTNDHSAYPLCLDLCKAIVNLPPGLFFVGDAAYSLEEHLLVPFTGSQKLNPNNDAFNFYLSQLRIRIEMAFGRLVRKFQILKRNMENKLHTASKVLMTCAKLHNFIIDVDEPFGGDEDEHGDVADREEIVPMEGAPSGMAYRPVMLSPGEELEIVRGNSEIRKALVEEISRLSIQRPSHNTLRNQNIEDIEEEYYHPN